MAVLPASKAYPRAGAPRRQYVKGAPLVARFAMRFNGRDYPRGAQLPIEQMSPHKHWELWQCGKADHTLAGPFDRKAPPSPPQAAPAVPSQATVQSPGAVEPIFEGALQFPGVTTQAQADALTDAELERLTAPSPATDKRRGRSR